MGVGIFNGGISALFCLILPYLIDQRFRLHCLEAAPSWRSHPVDSGRKVYEAERGSNVCQSLKARVTL